ncbi:hypothetical protein GG344DRAFT_91060 [Lentinula edodes]|nr:hypothetical protein GG344DRAFT_91060 [Lentinula edodes]
MDFVCDAELVGEDDTVVNEVASGKTHSEIDMDQGFSHAKMNGRFGNRGSNKSRKHTIGNDMRKVQNMTRVSCLLEEVSPAATRLYILAIESKFTQGRKSMNVVAVHLYVSCRQKKPRHYMLIDFSDILQVRTIL